MNDLAGLEARLGRLFAETFHMEAPAPEADLIDSGILDSLQMVELLIQLDRHFQFRVRLDEIDLENLRSIRRIAGLLVADSAAAARA